MVKSCLNPYNYKYIKFSVVSEIQRDKYLINDTPSSTKDRAQTTKPIMHLEKTASIVAKYSDCTLLQDVLYLVHKLYLTEMFVFKYFTLNKT